MTDKNGEKLTLMDRIVFDHGAIGNVVEFDKIGERGFVAARCGEVKIWGTENSVTKL